MLFVQSGYSAPARSVHPRSRVVALGNLCPKGLFGAERYERVALRPTPDQKGVACGLGFVHPGLKMLSTASGGRPGRPVHKVRWSPLYSALPRFVTRRRLSATPCPDRIEVRYAG